MSFAALLETLNSVIWSPTLVFLCLAVGVYFTLTTLFLQVRCLPDMMRQIVSNKKSGSGVSSFESLMISLAGRVGVGNIAGVATAIAFGGPGPCFGCGRWRCWGRPRRLSNARSPRFIRRRTGTPASIGAARLLH